MYIINKALFFQINGIKIIENFVNFVNCKFLRFES